MVPTIQLEEIAYLQLSRLHTAQGSGYIDPYSPAYLASLVQLAKVCVLAGFKLTADRSRPHRSSLTCSTNRHCSNSHVLQRATGSLD
jgi:hypothetical protein